MTSNQTVSTAAVIGLGFIGAGDPVSGDAIGQKVADLDGTHAHALAAHPQVQLVAGSSRDEGRRRRFEERMQVDRTYADWREMLAVEKPDIVGIATHSPYHAEITVACAEAGVRAILCEKPIATSLRNADRALSACRKHGTILAVNHSRRWHPLWQAVREEISNGGIGQVQHAVVHWSSGRLGNIGTHMFDLLRMLLGAEAEAVSGSVDPVVAPDCRGPQFRDPGGWGVVAFSEDIKAFIDAPHAAKSPPVVRMVGSLGQLAVRGDTALIEMWAGGTRMLSTPKDRTDSVALAVEDIVRCLTQGRQPASTGEDGLAALEMIIGFHVSNRLHGQWVPMPLEGEDRDLEVLIG
jgi:predicted dehydrogenase